VSYDESLAGRIRKILSGRPGIDEIPMFGGLAFMQKNKMFCGVLGRDLVARIGPDANDEALRKPHVRPMDFTGRPMRGYVYVSPKGTSTTARLKSWIDQAAAFAATLKTPKTKARRRI
jgi:TfoX/Sxy family transcriptional regulator of competence genes